MFDKFKKIKNWAVSHKKTSIILCLVLIFLGYKIFQNFTSTAGQTKYIISTVKKGAIVTAVTGSGQISTSDQVDIKPEVSGDITYIGVKLGENLKKGQIIASLDSTDASRAVQNAELALSNTKIAYDKATKKSKDQSADSSISDLNKAYEDGYKTAANVFIDLPSINLGVNDIYYDPTHSPYFGDSQARSYAGDTAITYKYQAGVIFDKSKKDYDLAFQAYRNLSPDTHSDEVVSLLNQTYDVVKELATSLTGTYNTIDYINERITSNKPAQISADKTQLSSYIIKVNSDLSSIQSALTNIENAKDSATTAELDLKSAELSLNQAQDSYKNAQTDLANHTIRAPFDGMVAKISAENGDKVTTASSIATLITKEKIAEISLNEVDISKIKIGQKATLTFDAIDGLTVAGEINEIDLLGTVSQGVVSYTVKVHLDTEDDRIKSGMSVNASVITDSKQDVLIVPSSSVKSEGSIYFVDYFNQKYTEAAASAGVTSATAPLSKQVEIGISDDTNTEVVSGLNEGDQIVTRTVTQTTTTAVPSIFNAASGSRTGGGNNAVRRIGG